VFRGRLSCVRFKIIYLLTRLLAQCRFESERLNVLLVIERALRSKGAARNLF